MLEYLLRRTNYNDIETVYLVKGFCEGFDFHYEVSLQRRDRSENLPLTAGNRFDLWDKVMNEVKELRFASPYREIPFYNYIQSPIGLVPKSGGKTRLIFHLSYSFNGADSFNECTPQEYCTVKYKDLDYAIRTCLQWCRKDEDGKDIMYMGKGDIHSAFRVIPGHPKYWPWTVLKACHPVSRETFYFVDKNLAFGASISCAVFQRFSDCLHHITETINGCPFSCINYLDDYFFCGATEVEYNQMVRTFIEISSFIGLTIAEEKTEWATLRIVFLGICLLGNKFVVSIPEDKRLRALNMAKILSGKRKATIYQLQKFTGFLNFLCKVIYPGHVFTRRMYAKIPWLDAQGNKLKQHHHVTLDQEFRLDCSVWVDFLNNHIPLAICRPLWTLPLPEWHKNWTCLRTVVGITI